MKKDKLIKDEILYDIQSYDNRMDDWYTLDGGIESKKEAKNTVHDYKKFDKKEGLKLRYRIIKCTIKKELVK